MQDHGFYSYKLNKPFKTLDELNEAENQLVEQENREKKLKENRAKDAKEIENLIDQKMELTRQINKKIDEFIKKYGSYHCTWNSKLAPTFLDSFFVDFF